MTPARGAAGQRTLAPEDVARRLGQIRARIERAGGDPERIVVLAVSKGFGVEAVRAALAAGVVDLGENYAQELEAKAAALEAEPAAAAGAGEGAGALRPRWHFIGRLQRNKVRRLAARVACWQSVDRLPVGAEIARRAPGATVLVQVNTTGEPTKGGCEPAQVAPLVDGLRDLGLAVRGLMTIGPEGPAADARPAFRLLRSLAEAHGLPELSMGMTADLEVAVQEGSTMVRVGTGLFGPRPERAGMRH